MTDKCLTTDFMKVAMNLQKEIDKLTDMLSTLCTMIEETNDYNDKLSPNSGDCWGDVVQYILLGDIKEWWEARKKK